MLHGVENGTGCDKDGTGWDGRKSDEDEVG